MPGSRTRRISTAAVLAATGAAVLAGAGGSAIPRGAEAHAARAHGTQAAQLKGVSSARTVKGRSITLKRPSRVTSGDVLVAAVNVRTRGMRPPAGWRLVRVDASRRGVRLTQAVYYKLASAREPASYRWRFTAARGASAGLLAYAGIDQARPVLAHSGRVTRNSRFVRAPSVTASVPNVLLLAFFAVSGRDAVPAPRGMAKRFAVAARGAGGASSAAAETILPAPRPSGVKAARVRVPHGSVIGQLVALRSATGSTQPPPPPAPPVPPPPPGGPPPPPPPPGGGGTQLPPPLPPSTGPTFYVATNGSDSNSGTLAQPWRTIQKAFNTLGPGERALVRDGLYGESLDMTRAGTAAAPITIESYPGEHPIVNGGGNRPLELSSSAAYIRVRGFLFEDSPHTSGGNVDVYGHHIELSGNDVRDGKDQGIYTAEESHDVQILGNVIHDNGEGIAHQSHGIYLQGDDHLVANNVIHDQPEGFGIHVYDRNSRSIIASNTVIDSGYSGIVVGGSGGVDNIRIVNNVFAFNAEWGIARDSTCPTASRADHNVVFGNESGQLQGGCSGLDSSRGNRLADPLFVDYENRDLHVAAGSPALDYALPEYSPAGDYDGRARPQAGPDAGAYERP
jgi:hypothetical protein